MSKKIYTSSVTSGIALLAGIALSGCSAAATGTVTGIAYLKGGPAATYIGTPAPKPALSGPTANQRVYVRSSSGKTDTTTTASDGSYSFRLAPGTYRIWLACDPIGSLGYVAVHAHATLHADLVCANVP